MVPRRFSSVVSWLDSLGIIQRDGDRYFLARQLLNREINILEFRDVEEPIMPRSTDLHEYEIVKMRADKAGETIISYARDASSDRADNAHRHLVNMVASRIKQADSIPRHNNLIDLATRYEEFDFIFEMKSITNRNAKDQIRKGVSQLYEYRFLQNLPDAKLILVIETLPPIEFEWMIDYLEADRNINVVWDGDDKLYGRKATVDRLSFLGLQL